MGFLKTANTLRRDVRGAIKAQYSRFMSQTQLTRFLIQSPLFRNSFGFRKALAAMVCEMTMPLPHGALRQCETRFASLLLLSRVRTAYADLV